MGNQYDSSGKHFEAKAVSQGEFEALKRFGDYEELRDGTLMRMEGEKEFRIYCEDLEEEFPIRVMTKGFGTKRLSNDRFGANPAILPGG